MTENIKESEYQKVPTKEVINDEFPGRPTSYGFGIRHVQAALLLLCMTVTYAARAHLGVTVVAMTKQSSEANITINSNASVLFSEDGAKINESDIIREINNGTHVKVGLNETSTIDEDNGTSDSIWNVYRTYEWDKPIQEMMLDAFYLGYFLMMFPTGMICQRFGGKIPLQVCLLVNGVVCFVTPTVAVWGGWKAVCCCRLLQGLSQSGLYPCVQTVLSKWVPLVERGTFVGYVYTGSTLGTVIAFQTGGALAASTAGWPATFWFFGFICIGTCILMTIFSAASPSDHKTISDEEKAFILGRMDDGIKKKLQAPWKQIFKSKHVWGTFVTHTASGVCFVFLFTQTPTYMHYILGFNIKNSGLLSSLPYIASIFFSIGYGSLSDYCTNRGYIKLRTARIICNSLAQVGPAVCLVAVTFTDNSAFAVFLLVLGVGLFAGVHTGWMVNYIDLSPNFNGTLMAIGNTMTSLATLSQPFLISNIVTEVSNRSQWRIMMFIMAGFIFVSNGLYVSVMSADPQPWDEIEPKGKARHVSDSSGILPQGDRHPCEDTIDETNNLEEKRQ